MAIPYAIIFPLLAVTVTAHPMDGNSMVSPEMSISICMPGSHVTAMPHCESWVQSAQNICPNEPTHDKRVHCMCNTDFLATLQGCQSELADCFQNRLNNDLEPAFSQWHSGCDKYVTLPPSSPVTAPPASETTTFSYDEDFCLTAAKQACESVHIGFNQCSSLKSDPERYSTCVCDPSILSNDYTCQVLLPTRCLGTSAAVSDMPLSALCDNFQSVIGTGIPDAATTIIHLSTTTPGPGPATPIGVTPTGPLSTAPPTPTNGAGQLSLYEGRATAAMVGFVVAWILF